MRASCKEVSTNAAFFVGAKAFRKPKVRENALLWLFSLPSVFLSWTNCNDERLKSLKSLALVASARLLLPHKSPLESSSFFVDIRFAPQRATIGSRRREALLIAHQQLDCKSLCRLFLKAANNESFFGQHLRSGVGHDP